MSSSPLRKRPEPALSEVEGSAAEWLTTNGWVGCPTSGNLPTIGYLTIFVIRWCATAHEGFYSQIFSAKLSHSCSRYGAPTGGLSPGPLSAVFFLDLGVEQADRPFSLNHPDHLLTGTRWQLSEGRGRGVGGVVGNDKIIKL